MMFIGVDYHPSFQQIAFFIEKTGECGEQELNHNDGEAERFYRDLQKAVTEFCLLSYLELAFGSEKLSV